MSERHKWEVIKVQPGWQNMSSFSMLDIDGNEYVVQVVKKNNFRKSIVVVDSDDVKDTLEDNISDLEVSMILSKLASDIMGSIYPQLYDWIVCYYEDYQEENSKKEGKQGGT